MVSLAQVVQAQRRQARARRPQGVHGYLVITPGHSDTHERAALKACMRYARGRRPQAIEVVGCPQGESTSTP
eukprot:scaffold98896_cov17-Phaeocystis_antarctica.AAC.2